MERIQSSDGTPIAFDRSGEGPPLIFVPGLFQHRAIDPGTAELAALLAPRFTVFHYDRRGRGDSGDTAPYAVEREVEDIGALIDAAGGAAALYGHVLRRSAGARGGRARPRGHEAGRLRAAVHRRRGQDRAVRRSSPPGSPSTSKRAAPATRSRSS